jgi:hypothetical protein
MRLNSRLGLVGAACALALALNPAAALASGGGDHGKGGNLIKSALTPSLTTDPLINGVKPGGAPWIIGAGTVRVRENGRMDVRILGLQIPRNGAADNPVASITAVLYCDGVRAADSGPQPMTVPGGDALFRAMLTVPDKCDKASVLISPSASLVPPATQAYIASAVAMDDDGVDD